MDDQNKQNQPLDQGTASSLPEDITPATPSTTADTSAVLPSEPYSDAEEPVQETPVAPPAEPTLTPVNEPETQPDATPLPEPTIPQPSESTPPASPLEETFPTLTTEEKPQETPFMSPQMVSEVPPLPGAGPVPQPTAEEPIAAPAEPPMPETKPKSKVLPIVGGIAALFLVIGVAGAAYYVSNQLSTRQAVAPTAPESKPSAADNCSYTTEAECNQHNCGVGCYWSAGSCHLSACKETICTTGLDCGNECCARDSQLCCANGCVTKSETVTACPTPGSGLKCPTTACYNYPNEIAPEDDCNVCNPDRSKLSSVTFASAGQIRIHQEGMISPTTVITLSKGSENITATKVSDGNYDATVTAGTYTIKVKLGAATEGGKEALGFIKPDSSNKCGRYDPNNKRDVSSYGTSASLTSFGINTLTGVDTPIQCWADTIQGEDTDSRGQLDANYDFNDFNLIIGYKATITATPTVTVTVSPTATVTINPVLPACLNMSIFKMKTDGSYETTEADLANLKVGDKLKFVMDANMEGLVARFGVKLSTATNYQWFTGELESGEPQLFTYSGYEIKTAGTYNFEAQAGESSLTVSTVQ